MSEKTSSSERTHAETGGRTPPPLPSLPGFDRAADSFLGLQRSAGNLATGRLLRGSLGLFQPKLRVGPPGDAYEREADRVADAVLRGPAAPVSISTVSGTVQRRCAKCQQELEEQRAGGAVVQRKCSCQDEEEEVVQPKASPGGTSPSTPSFEARVNALRGGGSPLPDSARSFFEPRFGHDLGAVRVHTGTAARDAARAVHARAFTVGNDVVFGAGEYSPESSAGRHLLAHELTHVVQQTPLVARRAPIVQREAESEAPASEAQASESEPTPESTPASPEPGAEPAAPSEASPATALLVEDGSREVGPGQMTKSDFLARLRSDVTAAAEAGLAGTENSTQGCPLIDFWFGYYERQSAERMNRDLPRFVGEGPAPATAEGYIPLIAARVRQSVAVWAETGKVTGVPEGIPLPGMSLPGVGAAAALGGVFFKARPGGAKDPGDPRAVRDRLGSGRALNSAVRSRMESAFGRSFSHVRMHTDGAAANLSQSLNARAFAVGEHVAFGGGEYRPGTLVGDALIAHELAHVAQQQSANPSSIDSGRELRSSALEQDADSSALGAMAMLWGGAQRAGALLQQAVAPRLTSGLRLQRCKSEPSSSPGQAASIPAAPVAATPAPEQLKRDVTIKSKDNGCGGFELGGIFSVENAGNSTNGFVVQQVDFNIQRESCQGVHNNFIKTYWEAWEVRNGVVYIGTLSSRHDSDGVGDHFSFPASPSHRGKNRLEGKAKYIPGYQAPYKWGNITEAGALPATTSPPAGWTNTGTIARWLNSEFDCCQTPPTNNFTSQE
jgi:hypothetical protein